MYYPFGFSPYFDRTYLLVLIGIVLTSSASLYIRMTYQKYNRIYNRRRLTGEDAARSVMQSGGIHLPIHPVAGELTDHYDPKQKAVFLSGGAGQNTSIAAVSIAAHECGHALQDAQRYFPLVLRHRLVPICNLCSTIAWPVILLGIILSMNPLLIHLGIYLFAGALLFQVVTLPVEFDASIRAIRVLRDRQLLDEDELRGAKSVLRAAALTYVAGTAATALQLLRLVLLFGNRNRD